MVLVFLAAWMPGLAPPLVTNLACQGDFQKIWTFVTYPLASDGSPTGLVWTVLSWLAAVWVLGYYEDKHGGPKMLATLAVYSVLGAILVTVAGRTLGGHHLLIGPMLPISALIAYWCSQNQSAKVSFMCVLPVPAYLLAILTGIVVVLAYGYGSPLTGVLAAGLCALGWFHGAGALTSTKRKVTSTRGASPKSNKEFEDYIKKVRSKEQERAERERLKKLLGDEDGP